MAFPKWLNETVFGASVTSFLSDFSHETVTVLLPAFLVTLGAPAYALGLIEGLSDGASSLVKLFSGYWADVTGQRRNMAAAGYLATGLFPAILALAASWPVILAGRVFGWMGRGLREPPRNAILADAVDKKDLGKAFGLHRTADTLGAILGPTTLALFLVGFAVRDVFWLMTGVGLLSFLAFVLLVRDKHGPKPIPKAKRPELVTSLRGFSRVLKGYLVAVLVFGASDFSHTLLVLFAVSTLSPSMGLVGATAAGVMLYTLRNVTYALACLPFGWLGDKFGRRNVLVGGYALAVLTFLGFAFAPANLWVYAVLFGLAGVFIACEDTLENPIAGELSPQATRGTAFGALATANSVGDVISSILVGVLWTAFGFTAGFLFAAVVGAVGTLAMAANARE